MLLNSSVLLLGEDIKQSVGTWRSDRTEWRRRSRCSYICSKGTNKSLLIKETSLIYIERLNIQRLSVPILELSIKDDDWSTLGGMNYLLKKDLNLASVNADDQNYGSNHHFSTCLRRKKNIKILPTLSFNCLYMLLKSLTFYSIIYCRPKCTCICSEIH